MGILDDLGNLLLGKRQQATPAPQALATPAMREALGNDFVSENTPAMSEDQRIAVEEGAPGKRKGGLLSALGSLIAPEPGSFMHSAYNNRIWNAKAGQQDYADAQVKKQLERQLLERDIMNGKTQVTPRGDVIRIKPDGSVEELYRPSPQAGEMERLIEAWRNAKSPAEKQILAQALRGYNYSRTYLTDKTDEGIRLEEAKTKGRIAVEQSKPPKGGGSGGGAATIPAGFIPDY